jgi:isopenicillin-N epimerase
MPSPFARHWTLEPDLDYLNHGSFGACPRAVLDAREELYRRLERQPITFLVREWEARLDAVRASLGAFLGADPEDLAPVANATAGVNTVLRSLAFAPGDELLITDHAYNACRNALDFVAARSGARVTVAAVPFPVASPGQVTAAVMEKVTPRTRLALIDHITSPTGVIFPVEEIVAALAERGIDTLVDGAHAPGMLPLDLRALGAAYYTGNCHKWICAPKGAAFLHVRRDRQEAVRPLVISHGANRPRPGRSLFLNESDWTGTSDPTPFLCIPVALETLAAMVPGGWDEVRRRNRTLALAGRLRLARALGVEPPAPEEMIGTLVSLPLPDSGAPELPGGLDPLQEELLGRFRIEVPIFSWPARPRRLLRISAQLYNDEEQYGRLAEALIELGLGSPAQR